MADKKSLSDLAELTSQDAAPAEAPAAAEAPAEAAGPAAETEQA